VGVTSSVASRQGALKGVYQSSDSGPVELSFQN
jgi:hypothetical protein